MFCKSTSLVPREGQSIAISVSACRLSVHSRISKTAYLNFTLPLNDAARIIYGAGSAQGLSSGTILMTLDDPNCRNCFWVLLYIR